ARPRRARTTRPQSGLHPRQVRRGPPVRAACRSLLPAGKRLHRHRDYRRTPNYPRPRLHHPPRALSIGDRNLHPARRGHRDREPDHRSGRTPPAVTYTNNERGHLADFMRGLSAVVVFAFLLVGCPVAMYAMGGSPIPDRLPSWEEAGATLMRQDTDQSVFLATIWFLGWGSWCLFIVTVCAEMINYFAGRDKPVLPRPVRPLQHLVRDLVATATLTFSAAASLATSASAATHTQ